MIAAPGPVRLIFSNPASAKELVAWLRATKKLALSHFKLGLYEGLDPNDRGSRGRIPEAIMRSFQDLTSGDTDLLRVDSLDER